MRVLYFIPGNVFGGAHNQCLQLSGPLSEAGYETVALLPDEPGGAAERLHDAGIEVHQRPLTRIRAVRSPVDMTRRVRGVAQQATVLARFLREQDIGMVQVHGLLALDGALTARRAGVPLIWQLIDTRPPMLVRRLLTPMVNRWADVVMTTGAALIEEYPGLAADASRHVPFYPPVPESRFRMPVDEAERAALRRALLGGDDDGAVLVGSLGNLNPQKGFEYLIDAIAELSAGHRVVLAVRGETSPSHPSYQDRLQALVQQHGMPSQTVTALPPDVSARDFMAALDVFALTPVRRSEGVPTVLLEAMWSGLPSVVTDVGAVAEVLDDTIGCTCQAEAPDSIVSALRRVVSSAPEERARMGHRARARAEQRFTLAACRDAHVEAYGRARPDAPGRKP